MADNRGPFKMDPSRGQELKRTHNVSSDVSRWDQDGNTDDSDKENKDGSLEGLEERVSTECTTWTHKPLQCRR
jgi:hypothetical protein